MIEIVDDNTGMNDLLIKTFGNDLPDAVMIQVCYKSSPGQYRFEHRGLDIALEKAKGGLPVILYGVEAEDQLKSDLRFCALVGMKNVAYIQIKIPFLVEEVKQVYRKILDSRAN